MEYNFTVSALAVWVGVALIGYGLGDVLGAGIALFTLGIIITAAEAWADM